MTVRPDEGGSPYPDPVGVADVVVVGGGPAGAAAAITLARAGRDVVLVDKARFPRDKCCGDGLTTGALRLLEGLGLDPSAVPSWTWVDAVWVRSPSGRVVEFPFPIGAGRFGAVAPRAELDAALLDVAAAAGAKVHDGHALTGVDHRPDHVAVGVDGLGVLRAGYVIAADGMWSPVRRMVAANEPGYLGEWHAFRQYASGVTGRAASELWVWFEPDILPGYLWSFPLADGRVNVGFGVRRETGVTVQSMKRLWPELLARPHVRHALGPEARLEATHKAWPIPARVDRACLAAGRVLFAGDAAAATDPLTGEGIAQALITGILAARAATDAGPGRPALAREAYRDAVRRELLADHRMSAGLGRILRHDWGARASMRTAGVTPWTRRNFGRWLFEDEPRAAAVTPRRWHRQFLKRAGAYA
jgi:geranylgeranyl reductase family protein